MISYVLSSAANVNRLFTGWRDISLWA